MSSVTRNGIDTLVHEPHRAQGWGRLGLLSNASCLTHAFSPTYEALAQVFPERLTTLFGPQHGFWGTEQDNMIETPHTVLSTPGGLKPLFSLYADTRAPTEDMLSQVDTLVVDLPITGCRVYTYKYTMAACLRVAARLNLHVVVLDRPNPLGGSLIEGPVLQDDCQSFVGEFPIPLRHGLTMGEAARFFNQSIGAKLTVIPLEGWNPHRCFESTGQTWIPTSPNLATTEALYLYPGMVAFEGTNISEGRGTTAPFQTIGAPYLDDPQQLIHTVQHLTRKQPRVLEGIYLRPIRFRPTFHKGAGSVCAGYYAHVLAPEKVQSLRLAMATIAAIQSLAPKDFLWKQPPYEYNNSVLPIRLILGHQAITEALQCFDPTDPFWTTGHSDYIHAVNASLLYPRMLQSL